MTQIHPFQKTFCALFISLTLIFYFTQLKKHDFRQKRPHLLQNKNSSFTYDDVFQSFDDLKNGSDFGWNEIFHTIKFLNNSLDMEMREEKSYELDKNIENIYILGLFELTTKLGRRRNEGESELMAAKMAVNHVNALNVIPGYKLVLLVNDTQCDPGVAIDRFFHAIYSNNTILMLLGSGCSNVSEALAHIVPYWNIIQVSYGSKSPSLSDRSKFPLFFRTVAPDSSHNIAKVHFIKYFKWQVVATFTQSENAYLLPVNHLITELERENVSCISTVTFSADSYKEQLRALKSLDIRIIIGSFSVTMAAHIFCAAYNLNMYGSEYVWILEQANNLWWKKPVNGCSLSELTTVAKGVIMIGDYENGYYSDLFWEKMKNNDLVDFTSLYKMPAKYATHTYDAIWTMSLTLRASDMNSLRDFHYKNKNAACMFFDAMRTLKFVGSSGPIRFNGADRVGDFVVSQIQGDEITVVALYDSLRDKLDFKCKSCQKIYWKNSRVPIAQRILKETLVTIPNMLFYAVAGSSFVGILCSFAFLYFNLRYRQIATVKLSSPNLNNLAAIGCILVYLSVILFGFHNATIGTKTYFDELCSIKIYLLSAGFSLTFGSMFAKSYRVHRLFTYSNASLVKDKLLRDNHLIGLISIPLVVDSLIMGLWITLDPLERHLHNLMLEISPDDPGVVYQPQVELCLCQNTVGWHIALFGYKSLILIMGVYMAWKTRHVKVPALNDSQYIGICVYTAIFSTIIVIVFSFITEYFILSYLAKTLSIVASTTITLMLLFLPKLKSIFGRVDTELSIMQTMGLKIQYNTRRFIWDDPKETLCRLEIQNKVYRCELQSLEKEIMRLEELLKNSTSSSNKSSINTIQIIPDIHFLNLPRASWPTWQSQVIKPFCSENSVKHLEKQNFFGKLKMFFGSLTSLQYSYNNLEEKIKEGNPEKHDKVKLGSNPEMYRQQVLVPFNMDLNKIKSENCIRSSY